MNQVELNLNSNTSTELPSEANKKIIECLITAAETSLPKIKKKPPLKELWKDDLILNEFLDRRKHFERGSEEFKNATKLVKSRVRKLKNEKFRKEAEEIDKYTRYRQVDQLYKAFKSDNSAFKEYRSEKKCDPSKLKEYFREHFASEAIESDPIELTSIPSFVEKLQKTSIEGLKNSPPDETEILMIVKKLKERKASNDIPTAFVKHAADNNQFRNEIVRLYKTIWETQMVPTEWGHSKLITIWKGPSKGKAEDPSTYRGLQIGSLLCKIMVMIIINRLKNWYEEQLSDQQQGFRPGRGTSDGIFFVKSVQQITNKMKKPAFLLFVDLTAAFDKVERKWLFESIKLRMPNRASKLLIELLEEIYAQTTTSLAENPKDRFKLFTGVRQGGPESPMLYNLFMDFVMRIYIEKCKQNGIKFLKLKYKIPEAASKSGRIAIGEMTVDWCGYADDLLLVFDDSESLQKGINLLNETFNAWRLKINVSKTKTMILNNEGDYPSSIATLDGEPVENVKNYKYLGCEVKFDEPTTGTTELTLRSDMAECKFYSHAGNLMNKKMNIKTRMLMLDSLVRSRLLYSCETWNVTKLQMSQLNSQYLTFIRKMMNGGYRRRDEDSWSLFYTNEDILRIAGATSLHQIVKKQQLSFVMKIIRKKNESILKKLMFNDDRYHKRGPQQTLLTSVLKSKECTLAELCAEIG